MLLIILLVTVPLLYFMEQWICSESLSLRSKIRQYNFSSPLIEFLPSLKLISNTFNIPFVCENNNGANQDCQN